MNHEKSSFVSLPYDVPVAIEYVVNVNCSDGER